MSLGASINLWGGLIINQETVRSTAPNDEWGRIGGTAGGGAGESASSYMYLIGLREQGHGRPVEPEFVGFRHPRRLDRLLIALAQVILKEALLKVEAGFRKGREQILTKQSITIGRAERRDVGLFGDAQVDFCHCRIVRKGNDYILTDEGSSTGTYVNDERILGPRTLRSGDLIRLGRSLLRSGERAKRG